MRINARLDENRARKLTLLRQVTGLHISAIVKNAIDVYYEQVENHPVSPAEALKASGFIGSMNAEPDLSETYKERLGESLAAKYENRR